MMFVTLQHQAHPGSYTLRQSCCLPTFDNIAGDSSKRRL